MTYDEIANLQKYLKLNTSARIVQIGRAKISDEQYPAIMIMPDQGGLIDPVQQHRMMTYSLSLKIQIIDTDDSEKLIRTLKLMDEVLNKINEFPDGKGYLLNDDFSTEYSENNFIITFSYRIFLRQQNGG